MSPKFRGGEDEWLDDEGRHGSQPRKHKKAAPANTAEIPLEKANATVIEVYPNQCRVALDGGSTTLLCPYRRNGMGQQAGGRERTFVAVGDRVVVSQIGNEEGKETGVVEGVCRRENMLSRPSPGRDEGSLRQVIGANLDRVVIVMSAKNPEFSPGLVDRFLIAVQAAGIKPVVCVTKIDLVAVEDERPWNVYSELGFPVIEASSKTQAGIEALRDEILGRRVLFCGQSGVGKTSLLRVLLGTDLGRVNEVSPVTGKGRHTTTSTVMLTGAKGGKWMDTPGMSEFGLADLKCEDIAGYYPEFLGLECDQPGCNHVGEEGCKAAGYARYPAYVRIFQSLKTGGH